LLAEDGASSGPGGTSAKGRVVCCGGGARHSATASDGSAARAFAQVEPNSSTFIGRLEQIAPYRASKKERVDVDLAAGELACVVAPVHHDRADLQ
jgi:hypothetical protein